MNLVNSFGKLKLKIPKFQNYQEKWNLCTKLVFDKIDLLILL